MYQEPHRSGPIMGQVNYFTFYGHSDDLACVQGNDTDEEYYVDGDGKAIFEVIAPGGAAQMLVTIQYNDRGTWSVALGLVDEDITFPTWPVTYIKCPYNAYSVMLRLEVPYATIVKKVHPIDDED